MAEMVYIQVVSSLDFSLNNLNYVPSALIPEGLSEACIGFSSLAIVAYDLLGKYYIINLSYLINYVKKSCPEGAKWLNMVYKDFNQVFRIRDWNAWEI